MLRLACPNSRRTSNPSTNITQVTPLIVISISTGPDAVGSTSSSAAYGRLADSPHAHESSSMESRTLLAGMGSRPGRRTTSTELLTK
ncbi:hypothetical protein GO279_04934 [Ralstonia solanacearum]|nr:hypothetical protein [Ralstonia solanacearum]NKF67745.1 hypothetical protein [Ralstonia solanacearum]